jgi:very-long-chain enoyl-CoA reductase
VTLVPPRAHNVLSYSMALAVFAAVAIARILSGEGTLLVPVLAGFVLWCAHFARRAHESLFVHRYGKAKVPTGDITTEYVYYWGFAAWNAWSLTSSSYRATDYWVVLVGVIVFVLAELGNAKAHRMLRDLRPAGSKLRVIPRGFLFERVSSPHYLFEILSWVGFAIVVQTWAALAFLLVGAGILGAWAHTRHLAYRKDFDGLEGREKYPEQRRALLPGIF